MLEDGDGKSTGMLDGDAVGDRVARLADHTDRAYFRPALFQRERNSRRETSAADRDQHGLRVGSLLGELEPDRPLAGDDPFVLEGVYERRAGALGVRLRRGDRVLEDLPHELGRATVRARRLDLRHRCVLRHEDRRRGAGLARRPRDGLAVVARARGHDARSPLGLAERGDGVVGAANLERARALKILRLQKHRPAGQARKGLGWVERRLARDTGEPFARSLDVSDRRCHRAETPPP